MSSAPSLALDLQFKATVTLNNFDIAVRRLTALASQSIVSSVMSAGDQLVFVDAVVQVVSVASSQIDLVSIIEASSLGSLATIQVIFSISYYGTSGVTAGYILDKLGSPDFLTTLKSNAIAYNLSTANAYANVSVSSVTVEQTFPPSAGHHSNPTVLVVAIIVSVFGCICIVGLSSYLILRYLSKTYTRRHMIPISELINEDADLGTGQKV